MKISSSKKELARIISENGGWRDGSEFAAQDGDGTGSIDFFKSKPRYDKDDKYWKGEYDLDERINRSDVTIKNFHQTILSRAEYFHLYPAPDADGWIEWGGEPKSPVENGVLVDVKLRSGAYYEGELLDDASWGDNWGNESIIAYRLSKPEQAKAEFCESVMRSIPEPEIHSKNTALTQFDDIDVVEPKPTIEQLASDYRNRKDYADRKQQEADDAKADAEAKLAELVAAGKALGLALIVEREGGAVTPIHPPLIAGDWLSWRQWEVGDFVSWSILEHIEDFKIIAVHHDASRSIGDFEIEDSLGGVYRAYGNECKFIRRP